jgi:hypothetical protein
MLKIMKNSLRGIILICLAVFIFGIAPVLAQSGLADDKDSSGAFGNKGTS